MPGAPAADATAGPMTRDASLRLRPPASPAAAGAWLAPRCSAGVPAVAPTATSHGHLRHHHRRRSSSAAPTPRAASPANGYAAAINGLDQRHHAGWSPTPPPMLTGTGRIAGTQHRPGLLQSRDQRERLRRTQSAWRCAAARSPISSPCRASPRRRTAFRSRPSHKTERRRPAQRLHRRRSTGPAIRSAPSPATAPSRSSTAGSATTSTSPTRRRKAVDGGSDTYSGRRHRLRRPLRSGRRPSHQPRRRCSTWPTTSGSKSGSCPSSDTPFWCPIAS